jgi:hypothetical protein
MGENMKTNGAGWFLWSRITVMLLMSVWLLWAISSPSRSFVLELSYFGAAFLCGTAYLAHLFWTLTTKRKHGDRPPLLSGPMAVWLIEPSIFLLVLTCSATELPLRVRFSLNESALTAYARSIPTNTAPGSSTPTTVGSFNVRWSDKRSNGAVHLMLGPCGLLNACGFVYSPNGSPKPTGEDSYRPFRPNWYLWQQNW